MVNLVGGRGQSIKGKNLLATRVKTMDSFCKKNRIQVKNKFKLVTNPGVKHKIKVIPQFCIAHFYCAHLITYNFIYQCMFSKKDM